MPQGSRSQILPKLRKTYEVTGCTFDGAQYCPDHCPNPAECETEHGACFLGDEWQCALGACDSCDELIDGRVIHDGNPESHVCTYCAPNSHR